jgi:selenocysteine lyase/cysteine desulfurase
VDSTSLYLDTARLGRMSRHAQQAHFDFTRLAGEEGGSQFFERFLLEGSDFWSASLRSRFPGLTCWRGIGPLKQSLRTLAGSSPALPVLTVNRAAQLMKFAARLLFQTCRNVLVTDLGWPPYREILESEARRTGRVVTPLALRELICEAGIGEVEVIEAMRERFRQTGCDGLFLTAVSHDGFRLPVERLVRVLEGVRELRFVVIDGAQDFCHASANLSNTYCDLYLAGCHKWLQGFHAMGLGFYGRPQSRVMIETLLEHLLSTGELDDPLLRFTSQLETATLDGELETVNLIPLFTCQGATADALERASSVPATLQVRTRNAFQAAALAESCGWHSILPAEPFRTGILLLQAEREVTRSRSPQELRGAFAAHGVALTSYAGGVIRLSAPAAEWEPREIDQLRFALQSVA